MTPPKHGIERKEWERRFTARIAERGVTPEDEKLSPNVVADVSAAELESWPEEGDHNGPDWLWTLPEEAADDQMENWDD